MTDALDARNEGLAADGAPVSEPILVEIAEYVPRVPGPGFWAALGWTVALTMALNGLATALVIGFMIVGIEPNDAIGVLFLCSTLSTTLLSTVLIAVAYSRGVLRKLAITRPAIGHVVLAGMLVGPLGVVVQEIAAWAGEVLPSFDGMYEEFAASPWPLVILAGCVLPAVGEELFFRGYLGRGLVARLGPWWGMVWTSTLFALIHLDPPHVVGILFVGLALHGILLASRSLLVPMLLHFSNNFLSFSFEKLELYSLADHLPSALVATGMAALIPVAILFWQSRSDWIRPDGSRWTPGYPSAETPPEVFGARLVSGQASPIVWGLAIAAQAGFWMMVVRYA